MKTEKKVIGALVKIAMCPCSRDRSEACTACSYRDNGIRCHEDLRNDCMQVLATYNVNITEAPQSSDAFDLKKKVSNVLHYLGIPASLHGYKYLREAIIIAIDSGVAYGTVTKVLYPTIARTFGSTSSRVERAIRHSIEIMWDRGDIDVLSKVFGYTVSINKDKPTNSECISILAEGIKLGVFDNLS